MGAMGRETGARGGGGARWEQGDGRWEQKGMEMGAERASMHKVDTPNIELLSGSRNDACNGNMLIELCTILLQNLFKIHFCLCSHVG